MINPIIDMGKISAMISSSFSEGFPIKMRSSVKTMSGNA
jgi:hypothetical protein